MNYFNCSKNAIVCVVAFAIGSSSLADEKQQRDQLKEPIFRVTKIDPPDLKKVNTESHPLDPAIAMAEEAVKRIDKSIKDYTCTMVKRERVNNELGNYEYIRTKIRHASADGKVPFSVYMQFRKPEAIKGREVIYVKGKNNNKMIAHEGGWKGRLMPSVWLAPTSMLAMRGCRYPATEAGIRTLCVRLMEKGKRDRQRGECDVKTIKNVKINKRPCTCIQVTHPKPRPYFDYHIARVYIDEEYNLPVRYEAFEWPKREGGEPVLLEEYTYLNLKFNVGLTDKDFDSKNETYNF